MKIQDVEGLKPKLKKALIEKGYTNVFVVINAPVDELKFLLSLDDDKVNQLLFMSFFIPGKIFGSGYYNGKFLIDPVRFFLSVFHQLQPEGNTERP